MNLFDGLIQIPAGGIADVLIFAGVFALLGIIVWWADRR